MSKKKKAPRSSHRLSLDVPESFRSLEAEEQVVEAIIEEAIIGESVAPILGSEDLIEETKSGNKPTRFWNGQRVYDCPSESCPFDALDEGAIKKHFKIVHGTPEAPPRGHLVLTDRFGNIKK